VALTIDGQCVDCDYKIYGYLSMFMQRGKKKWKKGRRRENSEFSEHVVAAFYPICH
jgi:hypothetical protein